MIAYYFQLAAHGLRRNASLTTLIVIAIGVGIGSSMSVYAVLRALASDPIPGKSAQLFKLDVDPQKPGVVLPGLPSPHLSSYADATALVKARQAKAQAGMYAVAGTVMPEDASNPPFPVAGLATNRDFFSMFNVPLLEGGPWSVADDEGRANVVVITRELAERLFPGASALGRTLTFDGAAFQIVGVLDHWAPLPRFYLLDPQLGMRDDPQFFVPLETAVDRAIQTFAASMGPAGNYDCRSSPPVPTKGKAVFETFVHSGCIWIDVWVELPRPDDVAGYRRFLAAYAQEQHRNGRFAWVPKTSMFDVREWLLNQKSVPDEYRVASLVAFGFLLVCLANAVALMLARFTRRSVELAVRRAVGAPRIALFAQCLVETLLIGALGAGLGLALTVLGLQAERAALPPSITRITQLDPAIVLMTLGLAALATLCAGVYPAWHSSRVNSSQLLKAQ